MVNQKKSFILSSKHGKKSFLSDVRFRANEKRKPVVLFIHGFKGFKDWGYFDLMANHFSQANFVFVKMNLSHNGTTPESPLDFADLEAFGNNNYTIELDDIGLMLDHIVSDSFPVPKVELDANQIFLMGHSRGGGISIIKAAEDSRVKKLITLASVSTLTSVMPNSGIIDKWKQEGVHYIFNTRTKQNMPLYYQLAEDYLANKQRFNVLVCESQLNIPHLIIHGDQDETVPLDSANELAERSSRGELYVIKGGNHVLGGSHPYRGSQLPEHAKLATEKAIKFLGNT